MLCFFPFFSILLSRKIGDHQQEDLTKIGYTPPDMKVKKMF
jgi:hypothetical protein